MSANPAYIVVQLLNGLSLGMNLFVIAAGLTLILGVLRVLNFAHGAFWLAVIGAAAALALMAFVIERLMLRHLYDRDHVYQLLFTFALVLLIGDMLKAIWGTSVLSVPYPNGFDGATNLGIAYYPTYRLFLCVVGLAIAFALWFVVNRTRWGRVIRAATQDREMLSALGLNVPRIYMLVFVAGSALAGVGGALASPVLSVFPGLDAQIIVQCFIIVIIGGLGSLPGAFLGAILVGQLTVFGIVFLPGLELVLIYLLMVGVLMFRPWGLLGRQELR